ncbi:DUF5690 family protein [Mucilaginibacter sp. SP1R1]|uniref:DUF5690 family protein n=1 Tax=Mucilaginibacter sp. SP1R1 TaxID=2723091 RepID=UPI00161FBA8C|nr:DUF5690 family protein [Mucilaginibacter sp. SP1R1]MBB6149942.1 MFS family permease [Mucilaginibacter sp. SP1R1]
MYFPNSAERLKKVFDNPAWALVAAFGTYFCMYGYRKPYTAAAYTDAGLWGLSYKFGMIIAQTIGYVLAKWIGIKFVSEIKPVKRIKAIIALIGFAEVMLLLFALAPRPWNLIFMLLNGLPLGIVFGLVLSFLEGRKQTEFLIAGLCASFILSDGVSKSVGAFLLTIGVNENWMPFVAGLVFLLPALLFITMLACVPRPTVTDVSSRSAREPMTAADRWHFFNKYLPGLVAIIAVYLFVTLLRSVRADFAVELWAGLGYKQTPELFTTSELIVSFGVILITGLAVLIRNHYQAFRFSLLTSFTGFLILLLALAGLYGGIGKFTFMVLVGLGVYLPYVAVHAVIFERLIAITRERATVSFLMYVVDSVGYTGYIGLMLLRYFTHTTNSILSLFLQICLFLGIAGILLVLFCYLYFKTKLKPHVQRNAKLSTGQSYSV